jgi:hypothetical protein
MKFLWYICACLAFGLAVSSSHASGSSTVPTLQPNCMSCCQGTHGNVNGTGIIDLADLSSLISYLTGGGFVLPCYDAANINGSGIIDLADLSALISYLTGGGYVLPNCPCVTDTSRALTVFAANPRYFTADGTSPLLLAGFHTWLNLEDGDTQDPTRPFNYADYLDSMTANHNNCFRLWVWEETKWTSEIASDYWFAQNPYLRTGPGTALDGKLKFDLTQFDQTYFDRLTRRVDSARQRGIYAIVMLFNGWSVSPFGGKNYPFKGHPFNSANNINGVDGDPNQDLNGRETQTDTTGAWITYQKAYIAKVCDAVANLPNVLFEVSNETDASSIPWQRYVTRYVHTYEATKRFHHPVVMSITYGPADNPNNPLLYSSEAEGVAPQAGITSSQTADGSKVAFADTDHLCGICGDIDFVWRWFLQGYNPLFMDQWKCDDVTIGSNAGVGGASCVGYAPYDGVRKNLGYAVTYAAKCPLARMTPQGSLSSTGLCLADSSGLHDKFLSYNPDGNSFVMNLTGAPSPLHVEWLNPSTGDISTGTDITVPTGSYTLTAPFSGRAVLCLY